MKIFLLEDNFLLNKIIKQSLASKGFFVESVFDGYKAAQAIINQKFDLYILDLNVNGFSGLEILNLIREQNKLVPVLIISSEIGIDKIMQSYDGGCNDYIKKPFEFEELMIRILYHSRHIASVSKSENIELGNGLRFDLLEQKLFLLDREIDTTAKEKLLLSIFAKNIDCAISTQYIHEYVWDGKDIENVSIRSAIHKLNKKLNGSTVVNVRGIGYKLILST